MLDAAGKATIEFTVHSSYYDTSNAWGSYLINGVPSSATVDVWTPVD